MLVSTSIWLLKFQAMCLLKSSICLDFVRDLQRNLQNAFCNRFSRLSSFYIAVIMKIIVSFLDSALQTLWCIFHILEIYIILCFIPKNKSYGERARYLILNWFTVIYLPFNYFDAAYLHTVDIENSKKSERMRVFVLKQ